MVAQNKTFQATYRLTAYTHRVRCILLPHGVPYATLALYSRCGEYGLRLCFVCVVRAACVWYKTAFGPFEMCRYFFFLSALQRYSFLSNEAHCIRSNWKRVKCAPIFTGAACVCVDFVKCLDKMSRNGSWSDRKFGNISNGYSVVCGKYGSDFNTKDRRKKAYKQKRVSTQTRTQPMRRRKFKRSTHLQRISRNSLEHIVRCSVFESFAAALQHCRCTYRIEKTSTQLG